MDDNFEQSLKAVLRSEGGYTNNPHDYGGATNFGITQRTYDAWRLGAGQMEQDVKYISTAEVSAIYYHKYWKLADCDNLPHGLDYAVFDWAVNSGPQRAVTALNRTRLLNPNVSTVALIDLYLAARMTFLRGLSSWQYFGKGWASRINSVRILAKSMVTDTVLVAPKPNILTLILNFILSLLKPKKNGVSKMTDILPGQKTNFIGIGSLAAMGGLAAGGGWQLIATYAPIIITVMLPVLAMTLHAAIKRYGLQSQAMSAEKVLAYARAAGWGPISNVAGAADDVLIAANDLNQIQSDAFNTRDCIVLAARRVFTAKNTYKRFALCIACKQTVNMQSASTPSEQIGAGVGALIAKHLAK